jgi:hypothetical protein
MAYRLVPDEIIDSQEAFDEAVREVIKKIQANF